jgi:formylmethanofuran--tetrahydromethanopterin N-formyltransferase
MNINGVDIEPTFAEAFKMTATRILITALNERWARQAADTMTGFATSVIGCGVEAGIGRLVDPAETPDGRPGVTVLLFAVSEKDLLKQLENRLGQCVLTCPTTSVFSDLETEKTIPLGKNLRYFGDGFQIAKKFGRRRYWRVPVMDGEFVCEETTSRVSAVGGGNFLVLADTQAQALAACEAAVEAMHVIPDISLPFPGGVVRSGSKVGSKYKALMASTNEAYCPTLRGLVKSELTEDIGAVMEIVIDGLTEEDVARSMKLGIEAVCAAGPENGIRRVTAGNYGGKLGQYQFHLHEILA